MDPSFDARLRRRLLGRQRVADLALLRPGIARLASADPRWTGGGQAFPDAEAALEWLDAERPNLMAAIAQSADADSSLQGLGDVLQAAGRGQDGQAAWLEAPTIAETLRIPETDEIRARLAALRTA